MTESGTGRRGWARARAEAELRAGDADRAGEALGLAAAEHPGDPLAAYRVALHWLGLGRVADAVPWLRRVRRLAPDSAEARQALAEALARRGMPLPPDLAGDADLADTLLRVPLLAAQASDLRCEPLSGGNRNRVFRVRAGQGDYVLRLGRARTRWQAYWEERHNLAAARQAGCAPPVLYMDVADGTLVMPYLEGVRAPRHLGQADFLEQAGRLLARLHDGSAFLGFHDPFVALDWRLERIAGRPFPFLPDLDDLLGRSARLRQRFLSDAPAKAPCHNDPVAGNFIAAPEGLVMVDWETSGMADPDWEVGQLLSRIPEEPARETFLAAIYGDADGRRPVRARMAGILARTIEMVEGLQMVAFAPEEEGWDTHALRAAEFLRAVLDR